MFANVFFCFQIVLFYFYFLFLFFIFIFVFIFVFIGAWLTHLTNDYFIPGARVLGQSILATDRFLLLFFLSFFFFIHFSILLSFSLSLFLFLFFSPLLFKNSQYPLVLLYTDGVSKEGLKLLKKDGVWQLKHVSNLKNPNSDHYMFQVLVLKKKIEK